MKSASWTLHNRLLSNSARTFHCTSAAAVCLLSAAACADDWPQVAHDAQRTARSADSPHPPFEFVWTYTMEAESVHTWTQPIIAAGRVYMGSLEGGLHCWPLEEKAFEGCKKGPEGVIATSAKNDLWTFRAGGAIMHECAYDNGRIFFGALDGCCYALDAQSGALLWKAEVGGPGFTQAALAADGKVFFGDRAGVFYAFDQQSGKELWRCQASTAPFVIGAAYANGRVYCGAEDMKIRALEAATGRLLWESETLPGTGLLNHYLVADAGKVIVRTKPFVRFMTTPYSYSISYREEGKPLNTLGWYIYPEAARAAGEAYWCSMDDKPRQQRLAEFNAAMRAAFEATPQAMTFHALDGATGKRAYIVPLVHNMVNTGPARPPLVGPDGFWYAGTTMTGQGNMCEVVKIDPATGDIVDTLQEYVGGYERYGWGGKYMTVMPDGSLSDDLFLENGWTGDEDTMLSIGGNVLYGRHFFGGLWDGIDLRTRITFSNRSYQSKYKNGYYARQINLAPRAGLSPLVISGDYVVGARVATVGTIFCFKGVKGE